jgi:hypothetical protein
MLNPLLAVGLSLSLQFAWRLPQAPATDKQTQAEPKKTQPPDDAQKRPSTASAATLDVPKLIPGIMPSEGQFKRCERAIVRARKLKNIDDETQNRIQVCKKAIATYEAEMASIKQETDEARRQQVLAIIKMYEIDEQLEIQACETKSCINAAMDKMTRIITCRLKPLDEQQKCISDESKRSTP